MFARSPLNVALDRLRANTPKRSFEMTAKEYLHSDHVSDFLRVNSNSAAAKRLLGPTRMAARRYPNYECGTALHLIYLEKVWTQVTTAVRADTDLAARLKNLKKPRLVALPTGMLDACSMRDNHGNSALVFDDGALMAMYVVIEEVASIILREDNGTLVLLSPGEISPETIRENCDRIAAVLIAIGTAISLSDSIFKLKVAPLSGGAIVPANGDIREFAKTLMIRGFFSFLMGHELAHLIFRHHTFVEVQRAVSEEALSRAHHLCEHHADVFGMQVAQNQAAYAAREMGGPEQSTRYYPVLINFGANIFFYILVALQELDKARGIDPNWQTHPGAQERGSHVLSEIYGRSSPLLVDNPVLKILQIVFSEAINLAVQKVSVSSEKPADTAGGTVRAPIAALHLRAF